MQPEATEVGGRKVFQLKGKSEDLDGVMVFNPEGKAIGFIKLPERCANLAFGGPKNNRLYMTSCHSIYALYVEAQARCEWITSQGSPSCPGLTQGIHVSQRSEKEGVDGRVKPGHDELWQFAAP